MFTGRVLELTEDVMLRWRQLIEEGRKAGRTFAQPDLIIAATALEHGMTLVTRNTRDFTGIGLTIVNPWEDKP
jgi:predicted nucleic acid-binding protein